MNKSAIREASSIIVYHKGWNEINGERNEKNQETYKIVAFICHWIIFPIIVVYHILFEVELCFGKKYLSMTDRIGSKKYSLVWKY